MSSRHPAIFFCVLLLVGNTTAYAQAVDTDSLLDFLGNAAVCRLSEQLMAELQFDPLYELVDSNCVEADLSATGDYYSDAACLQPVAYAPTQQLAFCTAALDKEGLGNGDSLLQQQPFWTLSPGTLYDLGARPLPAVQQPYMTRLIFREVETQAGTCRLEIRVYKNSPSASGLNTLIAWHGGSWTSRGFGFFGLELAIPHFTNAGYVVFVPFLPFA